VGALWHGFSDMGAVSADGAFVLHRGEGAYVWDTAGIRYLDVTAGLWFANVGHGRTEIAERVGEQLGRLAAYSGFGDYTVDVTVELAERLSAMAPVPDSKVLFGSGGSDSVETAAKLARRYWHEVGQPDKRIVIGRQKAYHGMHYAGTALSGLPPNREGYGELVTDAETVAWNSAADLDHTIERLGARNVAAFFCEPVEGAGGVWPPPDGYLAEARAVCRRHDVLFVADEVVTGFGRIGGTWFASSRFGLEPDIVTTAKGLTSGYVPMGATLVAPRVAEPFFRSGAGVWWRHGYTYGGHAGAAVAAMANLDIIEREHLLDAAARLEKSLPALLGPLAELDSVAEVRAGVGALAAVQLADPAEALSVAKRLRGHGIATRAVGAGAIQVSPPFVMTDDEVQTLASALTAALP